ncbi:MAG: metallophosphatase family protein [Bryobacteraceae bacterium]|nr:metallophosphatase family protein [Bryobacteraceae bacterium]
MRYLILSDIHANWEALDAVLDDATGRYDSVLCLGDLVGYGADPNRVTEWVRANAKVTIRGNHDRVCTSAESLEAFNPIAAQAASWTQNSLTAQNRDWLRGLPRGPLAVGEFDLVHGAPLDEDRYLVGLDDVLAEMDYLARRLTFFGHTHVQGGFEIKRRQVRRIPKISGTSEEGVLEFDSDALYLINPGSVGQPRDRDHRAAYALYDPEERWVTYRRVEYDVMEAQRKIREAKLPDLLADRLARGF